jgi:hypothetical protein
MSVSSPSPWPHNDNTSSQATFQARRPFSSSELLALQRKKIEQTLNAPPINTVNLQSSSEQTARVRKLASRDSDPLFKIARPLATPETNPVMKGGGTIPNRTSANVTARLAGNAYAADFFNYTPIAEIPSAGCSTLLTDNITFPKAVKCAPPKFRRAYNAVLPFSHRVRFGFGRNTNKPVIAAQNSSLSNNTGRCAIAAADITD